MFDEKVFYFVWKMAASIFLFISSLSLVNWFGRRRGQSYSIAGRIAVQRRLCRERRKVSDGSIHILKVIYIDASVL